MNVVFRTDASARLGTGHVMRCLTLADALQSSHAQCRFVCRRHTGDLTGLIERRGYPVDILTDAGPVCEPEGDERVLAHAGLLGAHWRADAEQTADKLGATRVDWLVVDHYALDSRWEQLLRPAVGRILSIDDIADRGHDCDALLDQNFFGDDTNGRYVGLVPDDCRCLLGPAYALLGPEYASCRDALPARDGVVHTVLIFIGGSDPQDHTGRALRAMTAADLRELALEIVVGANHPDPDRIERAAKARPSTRVHRHLPTLAELMAKSDLMIGGGGSTGWQRLCLGLPAIVIGMADNQRPTNIALHDAGYIDYLGPAADVAESDIAEAVRRSIADPATLVARARRGQQLVPGTGAADVSRLMISGV